MLLFVQLALALIGAMACVGVVLYFAYYLCGVGAATATACVDAAYYVGGEAKD